MKDISLSPRDDEHFLDQKRSVLSLWKLSTQKSLLCDDWTVESHKHVYSFNTSLKLWNEWMEKSVVFFFFSLWDSHLHIELRTDIFRQLGAKLYIMASRNILVLPVGFIFGLKWTELSCSFSYLEQRWRQAFDWLIRVTDAYLTLSAASTWCHMSAQVCLWTGGSLTLAGQDWCWWVIQHYIKSSEAGIEKKYLLKHYIFTHIHFLPRSRCFISVAEKRWRGEKKKKTPLHYSWIKQVWEKL